MKRPILKLLASALLSALLISCGTDDPVNPTSKMSGMINGQSFNTASVTAASQSSEFYIEGNTGYDVVKITTFNPVEVKQYALGDPMSSYYFGEVYRGAKVYKTKNYSGMLNVTYEEHSSTQVTRLIADYNFTAYNGPSDSVVVTNGKIDFIY